MHRESGKNIAVVVLILTIIVLAFTAFLSLKKEVNLNDDSNDTNDTNVDNKVEVNLKIDKDKEYIYDANYSYDNKYQEFDRKLGGNEEVSIDNFGIPVKLTYGKQYLTNLKAPYINLNSEDASRLNNAIEQLYMDYAKQFDICALDTLNGNSGCSQILTYKTYMYNDILSLVIIHTMQTTAPAILNYNTYSIDLTTGKILSYDDVLSRLNYNSDATLEKMKQMLKNKMDSLYLNVAGDLTKACLVNGINYNCYERAGELLEDSINNNTINFFVNNSGLLNVLVIPYYDGVQNGNINKYLLEIDR